MLGLEDGGLPLELLLIRHGEAIYGENDGLTEKGRQQAELLAERLEGSGLHHLYASPVPRARDTAAIVAARLGHDIRYDDRFREIDIGNLPRTDGEQQAQWARRRGRAAQAQGKYRLDFTKWDGEGPAALHERVSEVLPEIIVGPHGESDDRVALVAHGGFINASLHFLIDVPFVGDMNFSLANTSITRVHISPRGSTILSVNDYHHLTPMGS